MLRRSAFRHPPQWLPSVQDSRRISQVRHRAVRALPATFRTRGPPPTPRARRSRVPREGTAPPRDRPMDRVEAYRAEWAVPIARAFRPARSPIPRRPARGRERDAYVSGPRHLHRRFAERRDAAGAGAVRSANEFPPWFPVHAASKRRGAEERAGGGVLPRGAVAAVRVAAVPRAREGGEQRAKQRAGKESRVRRRAAQLAAYRREPVRRDRIDCPPGHLRSCALRLAAVRRPARWRGP